MIDLKEMGSEIVAGKMLVSYPPSRLFRSPCLASANSLAPQCEPFLFHPVDNLSAESCSGHQNHRGDGDDHDDLNGFHAFLILMELYNFVSNHLRYSWWEGFGSTRN